jgi:hypothetical protein
LTNTYLYFGTKGVERDRLTGYRRSIVVIEAMMLVMVVMVVMVAEIQFSRAE